VIGIATALAVQTIKGFHDYEFGLYFRAIVLHYGTRLALTTALAFVLQVIFNHKLAGFVGIALWFVLNGWMPNIGWDHPLYRFATTPPAPYSDMNGYGHLVAPVTWSLTYWVLVAALLLVACHLIWIRGTESEVRQRLRLARQRFGKPVAISMALLLAGSASAGGYIFYNTNVLNEYRNADAQEELRASMEKKYKKFEALPQPRVIAAKVSVDLRPETREAYFDGSYVVMNKSDVPIRDLHVTWTARRLTSVEVSFEGARMTLDDRDRGYRIYQLAEPLPPGATMEMKFKTAYVPKGFVHGASNLRVVHNGSFMNSFEFLPHLGYDFRMELDEDREKHGLPPLERMKPPTDLNARMTNNHGRNIDWISLDTTISTSADQIAVAPGYLQKEWTANGRRHFHYKTTAPIRGFWGYLSARYEVKRDEWNGIAIEIYYNKKHPYNVDHMIYAVKKSLAYFEKNFSPYQHKQVRILEFPGYATFAQALPNTIPWSEGMGFITDLRDPDALDYVFYVAAHEVAHQWWGHQVVPANVQGASVLTESLAQYSALMVLAQEMDDAKIKRYLRYELDRYLAYRGNENLREMPLALVERQAYIHYQKGALVLYALQDYIGEDRLNRALARFIDEHAFGSAPYPTALDLVQFIRAEAPPQYQELITDLFERIILYDLKTKQATVTRRADGRYTVRVTINAAKLRSDAKGEEKPIAINDPIDIAVFAPGTGDLLGKTLFLQKRRISKAEETFEIVVEEKPEKVGIDPFNKLIDREPKDNVKTL
jgi:ABC-2 type transport system permease protein